ncbi:hypothetical protein IMY05_C4419001300 [Salix suchowensis]|nr:hypothetical protein IMY05_C4419001300 [Salix suchowensis]
MHRISKTVAIFEESILSATNFEPCTTNLNLESRYLYLCHWCYAGRPNFESNGGSVMIVMVHSGVLLFNSLSMGGGSLYRVNAPVSVEPKRQLPPTNSGIGNGDYWNCEPREHRSIHPRNCKSNLTYPLKLDTISYQELMHLFNNGATALSISTLYTRKISLGDRSKVVWSHPSALNSALRSPRFLVCYLNASTKSGASVPSSTQRSEVPPQAIGEPSDEEETRRVRSSRRDNSM